MKLLRRLAAVCLVLTAVSACAGADVSSQPTGEGISVGTARWVLPSGVTLVGSSPTSTPTKTVAAGSVGSSTMRWQMEGSGIWDGIPVKVFARSLTEERFANEVNAKLRAVAVAGGVPEFRSLSQQDVNVTGASTAQQVLFSYDGDEGAGQGIWVAAVQSRTQRGVVVQVATAGRNIDPAFAQAVVDSLVLDAA